MKLTFAQLQAEIDGYNDAHELVGKIFFELEPPYNEATDHTLQHIMRYLERQSFKRTKELVAWRR